MTEELEKRIDEEKRDQLVRRINELYEEGVLRIRDWMAMYEILINACQREEAETMERIMMDSFRDSDEERGDDT